MTPNSNQWKGRASRLMGGNDSLSSQERERLTQMLLAATTLDDAERTEPAEFRPSPKSSLLASCLARLHRNGAGYLLTALATAAAVLLFIRPGSNDIQPNELTSLPQPPAHPTILKIPGHLDLPSSDRFEDTRKIFSSGSGHALHLAGNLFNQNRSENRTENRMRSSIVMVQLNDENAPLFRPYKQTTQYQIPGEQPVRLTTWSENGVGYALYSQPCDGYSDCESLP